MSVFTTDYCIVS